MIQSNLLAVSLAAVLFQVGCSTPPPAIDDTGLRAFWDTHAALASDEDITAKDWERLFSSPGYDALERAERRSAWMPEVYEHAFRPSLEYSERDWGAANQMIRQVILPHLRQAANSREAIDGFVQGWAQENTVRRALTEAQRLLPAGVVETTTTPPVQLVIIDGDGKALPDAVVIDAYSLYCWPDPDSFLGHEFHHIYRQRVVRYRIREAADEVRPLIRLLSQLEEEGVANLIDKREFLLGATPLPRKTMAHPGLSWAWSEYAANLDAAPDTIAMIDLLLQRVELDEAGVSEAIESFSNQTGSFARHAVGLFMADAIAKELGRERLIDTVGDPFAFAMAYNEAAKLTTSTASPYPLFTQDSVARLRVWQRDLADP